MTYAANSRLPPDLRDVHNIGLFGMGRPPSGVPIATSGRSAKDLFQGPAALTNENRPGLTHANIEKVDADTRKSRSYSCVHRTPTNRG